MIRVNKDQLKALEDLVVLYMLTVENKLGLSDEMVKTLVFELDYKWDAMFQVEEGVAK